MSNQAEIVALIPMFAELGSLATDFSWNSIYAMSLKDAYGQSVFRTSGTFNCRKQGSYLVTQEDLNNNQRFDAGDTMTIDVKGCDDGDGRGVSNGRIEVRVKESSSTTDGSKSLVTEQRFSDLAITYVNGDQVSGAGQMSVRNDDVRKGAVLASTELVEASRMDMTVRRAGVSAQYKLENVQTLYTEERPVGRDTVRYALRISSQQWGGRSIAISTESTLVSERSDEAFSSGSITITGSSSQLRLTLLNATEYRVELDGNGDGRFETQLTQRRSGWLF